MKLFDLGEDNLSYKKPVLKIIAGAVLSVVTVLFRAFITLPEKADSAAGTASVILLVGFMSLILIGAAEAVNVSSNIRREKIKRGETEWEPLILRIGDIYDMMEVCDIISVYFTYGGKRHAFNVGSDYGRGAIYSYNKKCSIHSEVFSSLDDLVQSETAASLGLDDPDVRVSVITIDGMDPRAFVNIDAGEN